MGHKVLQGHSVWHVKPSPTALLAPRTCGCKLLQGWSWEGCGIGCAGMGSPRHGVSAGCRIFVSSPLKWEVKE